MINNIYLILFNTGIFSFIIFFLKRFKILINFTNIIIFYSIILIVTSYLLYTSFFFNIYNQYYLDIFFYIIISLNLFLFISYKNFKSNINDYLKHGIKNDKFIIFYFFILFLVSLLPASDPDSLDYHLGAPQNWLNNGQIIKNDFWLHFRLASYGEALNIFSIRYFNLNFMSFLNTIYFLFISMIINNFIKKKNTFLTYFFLSTPIIFFFIFSQKPQFFGYALILISLNLFFLDSFKKNNYSRVSAIFLICYVSSLKFSFLPTVIFIFIVYLFYSKKKLSDIFYFLFFSLIFSGQIFYKNYLFYGNPISPFFDYYFTNTSYLINFSEYLQTFGPEFSFTNILLFPITFFIPTSFSSITTTYGLVFLSFLFIKNKNFISKRVYFILFAVFLSIIITSQLSNRYYFLLFFLIVLSLNFYDYKYSKFLYLASCLQISFISIFLIIYLSINFKTLTNENYINNFYSKNVYQYDETQWINKNIKHDKFTTDIRSKFFLNKNHVTSHYLHYVNKDEFDIEFNKFIRKHNIKFFSFLKNSNNSYFYFKIKNCKKNINEKKFLLKRRNFLAPKKYIYREIFELNLSNKNCLISKIL